MTPEFLSKEEVLAIHRDQLARWGGTEGLRDEGTLESALGQAGAVYSFLEDADLYDVAAAYAFSISEDQPFLDGNKRVGLNAALAFLELNGVPLPGEWCLFEAMMAVANGRATRADLADVFRTNAIAALRGRPPS